MTGKASPENFTDYLAWKSNVRVIFLSQLEAEEESVSLEIIELIDSDLNITETVDPECKQHWYPLGIKMGYKPALDAAHTFVSVQGRMKYLQPMYQALLDTDQLDLARQWYQENINFYHPYCVGKLAGMLGLNEQ
jgi:leukotriene-A4 hydrolase